MKTATLTLAQQIEKKDARNGEKKAGGRSEQKAPGKPHAHRFSGRSS
jgi:hypothetical protein